MSKAVWILLFSAWALAVTTMAQTKYKIWMVGNKMISFSQETGQPPVPATVVKTFPDAPAAPVNALNDRNGNLVFYVRNCKVYDRNDQVVTSLTPQSATTAAVSSEIPIVPVIEAPSCIKRYYVFYPTFVNGGGAFDPVVKLHAKIISVNLITNVITAEDHGNPSPHVVVQASNYYQSPTGQWFQGDAKYGIAVSKEVNQKRFLYFVSGITVQKITLTDFSDPNNGISAPVTIFEKLVHDYDFDCRNYEADLSDDGTKLAWGVCQTKPWPGSTLNAYFYATQLCVIGLDPVTGDYNNTKQEYLRYIGKDNQCRGIEFSDDGTKLFYTTGQDWNNGVISVLHLTAVPLYHVDFGTNDFAYSQLERGPNGLLYALTDDELIGFDQVTLAQVEVIPLVNNMPLTGVNGQAMIRFLPDQIDGEDHTVMLSRFPLFNNPVDPGSGAYTSIAFTSGTHVMDPAYFGGKTTVGITESIIVEGVGTELLIEGLTIEFNEGSQITVHPGSKLTLRNCTLKGLEHLCGSGMWNGIVAVSDLSGNRAEIFVEEDPVDPSHGGNVMIRDAVMGISLGGENTALSSSHCTFKANHISVYLGSGAELTYFNHNKIEGEEPLKDQSLGSANGYPDGLKRSLIGISANNALVVPVHHNSMFGGQVAINLVGTPCSITYNQLGRQKETIIWISNMSDETATAEILGNSLADCKDGITLYRNKSNIQIHKNFIANMTRFGVDGFNNHGFKLHLGEHLPATIPGVRNYDNQFSGCGKAAVNLSDNADVIETMISIVNNKIGTLAGIPSEFGVVINESSNGSQKYQYLSVDSNVVENLPKGIVFNNIVGGNPATPKIDYVSSYSKCETKGNTIITKTPSPSLLGNGDAGIIINSGGRTNHYRNTVLPEVGHHLYTSSVKVSSSVNSLIWGNSMNTGIGLNANGYMLNSNYYCNRFRDALTAISLNRHILRKNLLYPHGVVGIEARNNDFIFDVRPISYTDIGLMYSAEHMNKWVFTLNDIPNIKNYSEPLKNQLSAGVAPDACGSVNNTGTDQPADGDFNSDPEDALSYFNSNYYWQTGYKTGHTTESCADEEIIKLLDAEDLMANGSDYDAALTLITTITTTGHPAGELLDDYKLVYETWLSYKISATAPRSMAAPAIEVLQGIAARNPVTESPAAFAARAILWHELQQEFTDPDEFPHVLSGYITNCNPAVSAGASVCIEVEGAGIVGDCAITNDQGIFEFDLELVTEWCDGQECRYVVNLEDGQVLTSEWTSVGELSQVFYELACPAVLTKKAGDKKSLQSVSGVRVMPNPSDGNLRITGINEPALVRITDLLGRQVFLQQVKPGENVDARSLQSGVYFIQINSHVQKIIIE